MVIVLAFAACSSRRILSRVSTTRAGLLSRPASGGIRSRRTCVPLAPLIFSTTSSMRQPTTSFHHAARALADRDDAVAGLELVAARRRTAGHDLADHDHVVLLLQHRADAFQRQRHRLVEVFGRARIEVIGVRVDRRRHRR